MLNIIICDDEKALRRDLKQILETELGLMGISYRIAEYSSGEEVLREYERIQGQKILYLDIKLDNANGVDMARQIRRIDPSAVIIFVTVYPEFVFTCSVISFSQVIHILPVRTINFPLYINLLIPSRNSSIIGKFFTRLNLIPHIWQICCTPASTKIFDTLTSFGAPY